MSRNSGDWVPMENYGLVYSVAGVAAGIVAVTLVRHGSEPTPAPLVGAMEVTDDLVVERVVGQLSITTTAVGGQEVKLRITTGIFDEDSSAFAIFEDDLYGAGDANAPFLWERIYQLPNNTTNTISVLVDPGWSMVDCRVNRRLARDQALILLAEVASGADTVRITGYLRSWVRRGR